MAQEADEITTVETHYFPEVLEHFDDHGHLIDPNTKFNIGCYICHVANLGLVNHASEQRSSLTHEPFAVLPRCGHAFGYQCIMGWLLLDINKKNPKCPACRKEVYSNKNSPEVFLIVGVSPPEEQHMEINAIRKSLRLKEPLSPPSQTGPAVWDFIRFAAMPHGP
ncbi:hypothetical protein Daesc_009523 [Daldinia eschscholtzii]|uniref:RING-type domain-containing protein n=1 Tax=Daldinia eschscholtzii TaxID=292717 RepID=A0AAX6MAE3_9PEZI